MLLVTEVLPACAPCAGPVHGLRAAQPHGTHRAVGVVKDDGDGAQQQRRMRHTQQQRGHGLAFGRHAEASEHSGVDSAGQDGDAVAVLLHTLRARRASMRTPPEAPLAGRSLAAVSSSLPFMRMSARSHSHTQTLAR